MYRYEKNEHVRYEIWTRRNWIPRRPNTTDERGRHCSSWCSGRGRTSSSARARLASLCLASEPCERERLNERHLREIVIVQTCERTVIYKDLWNTSKHRHRDLPPITTYNESRIHVRITTTFVSRRRAAAICTRGRRETGRSRWLYEDGRQTLDRNYKASN